MKNILDHWHPVLASAQLKTKPVEIEIAGQAVVLFRDKAGRAGALSTRCPHRGMNLSHGKVQAEGLTCPYHGWSFAVDGTGKSPCNPKMKIKAPAYDVREYAGYVWLTGQNSGAPFPAFLTPGFGVMAVHVRRIEAPLEPVLDNFLEIEHFPVAHSWLTVDFAQIGRAELIFASDEDTVSMNYYPAEQLPAPVQWLFRMPKGSRYYMDITAHASPLHTIHHQGFHHPAHGIKKTIVTNAVFYVPINRKQTLLVMFLLTQTGPWALLKKAFLYKETRRLIEDDLVILNHLADKRMTVKEMRLGAYDKALIEVRKRLPKMYADYYSPETGRQWPLAMYAERPAERQADKLSEQMGQAGSGPLSELSRAARPLRGIQAATEGQTGSLGETQAAESPQAAEPVDSDPALQ